MARLMTRLTTRRFSVAIALVAVACLTSCTDEPPPPHQFRTTTDLLCDDLGLDDVARTRGWLRDPVRSHDDRGDDGRTRQSCTLRTTPGAGVARVALRVDLGVDPDLPRRTVDVFRCDAGLPECDPGVDVDGWWDDGLRRVRVEPLAQNQRLHHRTHVAYGNALLDVTVTIDARDARVARDLEADATAASTDLLERVRDVLETRLAPEG